MLYKMRPGDEPVVRRALEAEENMLKLKKSSGFLPSPPDYGRWHSGEVEECCQVDKAGDLGWASSGRTQKSKASLDCFYTLAAMKNIDLSIYND